MAANPYFLSADEITDQVISYLPPAWQANFVGKILKRLIVACAYAIEGLYALSAQLLRLAIPITSEGEWLRAWGRSIGLNPYGGVRANGVQLFERYRLGETTTIPAGARVQSPSGILFEVLQSGIIAADEYQVIVPVRALSPGVAGNQSAGQIGLMVTPISGVDRTSNPTATTGGIDAESDESIRGRVGKHLASLHRGTGLAIEAAIDPESYPEVRFFKTYENAGIPGYIRAVLSDVSGGDLYRPVTWASTETAGLWTVTTTLPIVEGVLSAGWPCRRLGQYTRLTDGQEVWQQSATVADCAAAPWRFFHEPTLQRLYISTDGTNPNTLAMTIGGGVIWRAQQDLALNWVSKGVAIDVIVPAVVRSAITLSYELESGYSSLNVETALRSAVVAYVARMTVGQDFELEGLFPVLASVPGARGVLITAPAGNIIVGAEAIFRLSGSVRVDRRLG
jgi:Baseplate J-like protein